MEVTQVNHTPPNSTVAEHPLTSEGGHESAGHIRHLLGAIDGTLKFIVGLALFGELGVVSINILARSLGRSFIWSLEAAELALAIMAFVGGALAYRRGEHAIVRTLIEAFPQVYRRACYTLMEILIFIIAVTMGLSSVQLFFAQWEQVTPLLQIRVSWFVLPLVLSMIVVAETAVERLLRQHRATVFVVVPIFSLLVLILVMGHDTWQPMLSSGMPAKLGVALFLGPLLLGLPIGFALLSGTMAFLFSSNAAPMVVLANTMNHGTANFVLLALPFFIFAGLVMNEGGMSRRLVHMAHAFVGHLRGGLFQVMIVSMYIVSGLSGSKSADVAAVGSVMRDMLHQEGYSLERSTAVLSASAVMGETVPPSIAILVLASVTSLSTGALFIGGLVPAAVIGLCLMVLVRFQSRRLQVGKRASLHDFAKAALGGILPLIMPVLLIGGIVFGVATPTEVASFAVIYGLMLGAFIYQELGFRTFLRCLVDSASVSGMILFVLAAAKCFSWAISVAQLPQLLVTFLSEMQAGPVGFLLLSIPFLIVIGAILEGLPALLILAPILLPIASQLGVNQLHYGIILVIATGFGSYLPAIGLGFYVACVILQTTIEGSGRAMVPYIIVLILGLLLVALVPWFTLFLPEAMHFVG